MRTVTPTEKYRAIQEGAFSKAQFLRDMRMQFPRLVTNHNSYDDAVNILKSKGFLFEEAKEEQLDEAKSNDWRPSIADADRVDLNTLERGIDYELEKMGVDTTQNSVSEEDYDKAKAKAVVNLSKSRDYYLHKIAGTKPKKNKKVDAAGLKPIKGNNLTDKEEGFQKLKLQESKVDEKKGPCWDGYEQVGMKDKDGKQVPNCVPVSEDNTQQSELFNRKNKKNKSHAELLGRIRYKGDVCEVFKFEGEVFLVSLRQNKVLASTANYGDPIIDAALEPLGDAGQHATPKVAEPLKYIAKSKVKSDIIHKDGERGKEAMKLESEKEETIQEVVDHREITHMISTLQTEPEKYGLVIKHLEEAQNALYAAESGETPMSKQEKDLYEAVKKIVTKKVKTIFEQSLPKQLNEAKSENLERFINYENDKNEDLAARIRKGATTLAEYIAKIEKNYLETRDNIEKVYSSIGPIMAPSVALAFKEDLKPVMAKYLAIDVPKSVGENPDSVGLEPEDGDGVLSEKKTKKK